MVFLHKLAFIGRWYFWYNLELALLHAVQPKGILILRSREAREASLELDRRRSETQAAIYRIIGHYGSVCASCGACCKERVDRFTVFDAAVRAGGPMPLQRYGKQILSLPWMLANGLLHSVQNLFRKARRKPAPPDPVCEHLKQTGCSLAHADRPMLCASWFCPTYLLQVSTDDLRRLGPKLHEMERIHWQASRLLRRQ